LVCGDCVYKEAIKLVRRHSVKLDWIQALVLAEKAMERVERRARAKSKCSKCKGKRFMLKRNLFGLYLPLLLRLNVKSTIFWTLKKQRITWILKGYNPDYTQSCTIGTCSCDCTVGFSCTIIAQCPEFSGSCGCPTPLPNSSQVSPCTIPCDQRTLFSNACTCRGSPRVCGGTCTSTCAGGSCGYNCDPGYTWNGVQCVSAAAKKQLMDGYVFIEY
jgi:hypothetical protein